MDISAIELKDDESKETHSDIKMAKEDVGIISKERIRRFESSKIDRGERGGKKTKNYKERYKV